MARNAEKSTLFGRWLREERKSRGLTMEQVADRADISQVAVSNIENGNRMPARDTVHRIARALVGDGEEPTGATSLVNRALAAAGFLPGGSESARGEELTLEREYELPDGDTFKIYGLGDLPPEVVDGITADVDRRMRELQRDERLKRYESQGHEAGAGNGEETRRP